MVYRIYSITEGIPEELKSEIFLCSDTYQLIDQPGDADFFAYPTHYQVAYDYTDADFALHGITAAIQPLIRQRFADLDSLARLYQKKIITVYIRDNAKPLPVEHAIVFRTSLTASGRQRNEFAFPANGRPLQIPWHSYPTFLTWRKKPAVGFRGQAAPWLLPHNEAWRNQLNMLARKMGLQKQLPIQYNFGYLHRRNALVYLQQNKGIDLDAHITTAAAIFDPQARKAYAENLLQHPYSLCVSGHGNYSFRLYETMAAGRIPLFVNTDCVLPLEEIIDYKNLFVWVESNTLHHIASSLLQYHGQHEGAALEKKQQQIQKTWQAYCSELQYYRHLPLYLQHFS